MSPLNSVRTVKNSSSASKDEEVGYGSLVFQTNISEMTALMLSLVYNVETTLKKLTI